METKQEPIAPQPYTPTGDKAKDKKGEADYQAAKAKYDTDLAEYQKSQTPDPDKEKKENEASIKAIKENKDLSEDEKNLLLKAYNIQPTEQKKEESSLSVLTPEQKKALDIYAQLSTDPAKKIYFNALLEGNIESIISEMLPKGEDFSKLTDEQIYERSLVIDGYTGDDLKFEMEEFGKMKGKARRTEIDKAKKTLSEKSVGNLPEKLKERLQLQSQTAEQKAESEKQYSLKVQADIKKADTLLKTKLDSVVGKQWNGITIEEKDLELLGNTIISLTPKQQTAEGATINVDKGFELGMKVFAFDKLQKEVSDWREFGKKRFRVSDGSPANTGAAQRVLNGKDNIDPKTGKAFW